jgi:integrase/recombinase XerD
METRITTHPQFTLTGSDADLDQRVIAMWLHGKSEASQKTYRYTVGQFRAVIAKPLRLVTLEDLQQYGNHLIGKAPATQARAVNTLKSLFRFAHECGYLPFNPAVPLKAPKVKDTLAERILDELDVLRLIDAVRSHPRNHLMLYLTYASGCRVSELVGLKWRDVKRRGEAGQVTLFGKGGKTRVVLLPAKVWRSLMAFQPAAFNPDSPIFVSRNGGHLSTRWVEKIVKAAAIKAGLPEAVCPHFLRHSHASHALENGASIALVQQSLGHSDLKTTSRYTHARPNESSSNFLSL